MPNVSSIVKQLKQERDRIAKQLSGDCVCTGPGFVTQQVVSGIQRAPATQPWSRMR